MVGRKPTSEIRPRQQFEDVPTSTTHTRIRFMLRQEVSKKGKEERERESEWNFENPFDDVSPIPTTEQGTRSLALTF